MVPIKKTQWKVYKIRYLFYDYIVQRVLFRRILVPILGKEIHMPFYGGKRIRDAKWTGDYLSERIKTQEPLMASRFGNTELNVMNWYYDTILSKKNSKSQAMLNEWWENLYNLCGFFPRDERYQKDFVDTIFESAMECDLLGEWNRPMEDYYLKYHMQDTEITKLAYLEPWHSSKPWTWALEGKRVLVIHPFAETIKKQYSRRNLIFPDGLLPEFDLQVLKAVQTLGDNADPRFSNWFEALEYMYQEALRIDFDVAIIGCGAYGMPLAAKLKKAGKKAIHLGGVTQCLFGIKGKRWLNNPNIPMNEYWVFPSEDETPAGASKVEGGCYW